MLCEVTQIWGLGVTAVSKPTLTDAQPHPHRWLHCPSEPHSSTCSDHIHLAWTVSQMGGREARPGFLQIVRSSLQLFQAFKRLGLALDTHERSTSSGVILPLLTTPRSWTQPAQREESIGHPA